MTKKLDPEVKATRRRYRLAAKMARDLGVPPRVCLALMEDSQDLLELVGEETAVAILMHP